MIRDIYIRSSEDSKYISNILDHSDPVESIIEKIKMILGTSKTDVLGDANFGVNIEDMIFTTSWNSLKIETEIKNQIAKYIETDYDIDIKVSLGKGDGYDYGIIDIYINQEKVLAVLVD
jgi:hypothetical protein